MRGIMISSEFRGFEGERVRGCQQSPCARYDAIRSECLLLHSSEDRIGDANEIMIWGVDFWLYFRYWTTVAKVLEKGKFNGLL